VVVEPGGSTFLFRYDDVEIGRHWAMPGGGIEPGETPRQAARRELFEETGWTDIEPGPLLWTWAHDFTRYGVPTRQHDSIYLGRGARREPSGDLSRAHVTDEILEWRWFTPADLATGSEVIWPPGLFTLLADLDKNGPPASPIDLNDP
jgi:8-oxo-dGTP pyrophosphatase MutT (NUDIX family)